MKIREFQVQNFRSLKNVSLENIGDLGVFIGGNSSGKSNLLEAMWLFFNEFDPSPQRNVGSVNDYIWFKRRFEEPIQLKLALDVSKDELMKILPEQIYNLMTLKDTNRLEIARQITGTATAASWSTKSVRVDEQDLIKDGQFVFKFEEPKTEAQASQPKVPPAELYGRILQNLSQMLKGKFKVVLAARNAVGSPGRLGDRVSFIQPSTIGELTTYGQSSERDHQQRFMRVEEYVKTVSPDIQDLRVIASQVTLREKDRDLLLPVSLVGGGYQEILALAHELRKEPDVVYGLEEPEQHLHPELARHLLDILKTISKDRQIFITTHSTVFVDRVELGNTWIVRKEDEQTTVVRLKESEDLKRVMFELGVRPSDIFFSNGIIFVEGQTEKVVLPTLANKMGINFQELELSVIPIYGKSSGRYHLKTWIEASKSAQIPYFMVLDKGAEGEAKKFVKDGLLKPDENLFILKKGSIEDYYPPDELASALKDEYEIELNEQQQKRLSEMPVAETIEKLLKDKGKETKGWKVAVGSRISQLMLVEHIDDEIKRILERIQTNLRIR